MKRRCKMSVAFLLVLGLLAPLSFGCGGDGEGTTITIGEITDLTGPASPALISVHLALEDLVKYYNDEGLIPGAKLKLTTYNNRYDPARDVPGYDWCKERGAKVVLGILFTTAETLKSFAERDKTPVVTVSTTNVLLDPPGWVFCISAPFGDQMNTLLNWLSENRWDYDAEGRVPKVGLIGWAQPATIDIERGVKAYCQAHSDRFQWIGSAQAPPGTMTFSGEVEKLKDADYLIPFAHPAGYIIKTFREKGYDPTFIADSSAPSYKAFYSDLVGWEGLDGFLNTDTQLQWWDEPNELINLARELLEKNHPDQAEEIISAGSGYGGGFITQAIFMEMVKKTVEQVGAENFSGQAFYDASLDFEVQFDGHPRWYFTETSRGALHHVLIHEWSAAEQTLVRLTPDWLPLVTE